MKKTAVVLGSTLALFASIASAQEVADSETTVFVNVASNLAVNPEKEAVNIGDVMSGTFGKIVKFSVQSNREQVWMSASATHLYKGMDPNSVVDPLMVDTASGVTITPTSGQRLMAEGGDNTLALTKEWTHSSGMKGYKSERGGFESSQDKIWDQYVDVDFSWVVPTLQTEGEYGGYVSLWVYISGAASAPAMDSGEEA